MWNMFSVSYTCVDMAFWLSSASGGAFQANKNVHVYIKLIFKEQDKKSIYNSMTNVISHNAYSLLHTIYNKDFGLL